MTLSGGYLFIGLIILAGMVSLLAIKVNLILFRIGAALSWLTLGILLLTNQLSTGIAQPWTQALGFLFLVMTIAPLTLQMVTEIKTEKGGKSWIEWGKKPVEAEKPRSQRVYEEHKARIRAARMKRLR